MQNPLVQILMNQVRARNPQAFQFLEQAQRNQSNPMDLLKQITNGYTPEQMSGLLNKAKQFGISDEQLGNVQQVLNKKETS